MELHALDLSTYQHGTRFHHYLFSALHTGPIGMWVERNQLLRDLYPTQGRKLALGIYETINQMSAMVSMDLENTATALAAVAYKHLLRVFLSP